MTDANDSFAADLAAALGGSRAALDRLLTCLEGRFREDAQRRLGTALRGRTRVSDVLQDAYVEVVRSLPKFAGSCEGEFFAWVTRIIENAARRQHRHLTAKKRKPPSRTSEWNALTAAIARRTSSPLSDLQKTEDADLILEAIGGLRDDHRVAIEQLILLERPLEEVAHALGRTAAATRMLLSRARAALTVRIDQLYRDRHGPG